MASDEPPLSAEGVNALVSFIIRPPRATYPLTDLGARTFTVGGTRVNRTDVELRNGRGLRLQASHYVPEGGGPGWGASPVSSPRASPVAVRGGGGGGGGGSRDASTASTTTAADRESPPLLPAVVYCHGNGSCRVEAQVLAPLLLPYGVSLFALDFSGSGRSDGAYISLGVFEQEDVAAAVRYLLTGHTPPPCPPPSPPRSRLVLPHLCPPSPPAPPDCHRDFASGCVLRLFFFFVVTAALSATAAGRSATCRPLLPLTPSRVP